ncbi:hypothetical protein ACJX0J_039365, partial [Zea mays]
MPGLCINKFALIKTTNPSKEHIILNKKTIYCEITFYKGSTNINMYISFYINDQFFTLIDFGSLLVAIFSLILLYNKN